jgi:hypothetical protein
VAQRVFFLNKLREGVEPAAYEHWVRTVDYPFARSIPSIRSYVVTRLDGVLASAERAPYDFLEVLEVTDLDAYQAELSPERPEVQAFDEEWLSFVGETTAVFGEVVEEPQ